MLVVTMSLLTGFVSFMVLLNYLYWAGLSLDTEALRTRRWEIMINIRRAYLLTGLLIAFVPSVTLYMLYMKFLYLSPMLFSQSIIIFGIAVMSLEVMNAIGYRYFDEKRMKQW